MVRKLIPDIVDRHDVYALCGDATVRAAARGMAKRDVNSALIIENGRLLGIFTGTDLLRKVVAEGLDPETTRLTAVMTPAPSTATPDMNAVDALRKMQNGRFRHLPIVENERVVGVVSRRDFLGYEIDEIEHQDRLWERL